mgnify:FL=1
MDSPDRVVLLDFSSEKNRGDAAMQVGLLNLVTKYFPNSTISVISVIGANQQELIEDEHDHSSKYPINILGGLKPTFYSPEKDKSILIIEIKQALTFLLNVLFLFLVIIKVPFTILAKLLPKSFRSTLSELKEADLIIWKGKNFRKRKNNILDFYRLFAQVYHPIICIALSKPIACISASVWHLKNPLSRKLLKWVFRKCVLVSVRENNSYKEAKKLLKTSADPILHLLPDLSFAVYEQAQIYEKAASQLSNLEKPSAIGLTIVDWMNDGEEARENYKDTLLEIVDHYLRNHIKIVVIPQVTKKWEAYDSILVDILKETGNPEKIEVLKGDPDIYNLFSIYSDIDLLIATRMHSAIFSAFVGTPLVAIPYDKGGKWNIIKDLGYEKQMINYTDVTFEKVLSEVDYCWKNRLEMMNIRKKMIQQYADIVEKNISLLRDHSLSFKRISIEGR